MLSSTGLSSAMATEVRTEGLRARIESRLHGHWYSEDVPPWHLRALEGVYRCFRRGGQHGAAGVVAEAGAPRIVVGNITAGGSGKTPLVIALCRLAGELGLRAGVASSGYGRNGSETIEVGAGTDPRLCGDEPLLLAQNTAAAVVVARRRRDALARLEALGVDVIIADDGLQTPGLRWDITVCVVDGERGTGNGHLLPAGPLREPPARLHELDYVVSKGEWPQRPRGLACWVMRIEYGATRSLDGRETLSLAELRRRIGAGRVHAVAGIAYPDPFFTMLRKQGFAPVAHRFADHQRFEAGDFAPMRDAAAIIMTEKDAVKCRGFGLRNAWFVPVEAVLPTAFKEQFSAHVERLRRKRT